MSTRSTKLTVIGIGLAALVAAGAAMAAGHRPWAGEGRHPGLRAACMHVALANLVDDLDLQPAQEEHLAAVHQLVEEQLAAAADLHEAQRAELIARLEAGDLDPVQVRLTVDLHLERLRGLAYQVADALVVLANSLDAEQKATLIRHLQTAPCAPRANAD